MAIVSVKDNKDLKFSKARVKKERDEEKEHQRGWAETRHLVIAFRRKRVGSGGC